MTVIQRPSREAMDHLLTLGVAQIEKEADLRHLLLEGNKGEPFTLLEKYFPCTILLHTLLLYTLSEYASACL